MRKYKYIIAALLVTFVSFGCTSAFLDVDPTTEVPMEDYYDTEEKITKGLVSAYGPLQWPDFVFGQYAPLSFVSDVMSDDVRVGGANANDITYLSLMRSFSATGDYTCSSLWVVFYSGVYRANLVINNMDNVKDISPSNKKKTLAEAHTLRAYNYYWLWKLWGNIPYYTENQQGPDYLIDQMNADDVYAKIIEDLDYAISDNKLPFITSAQQKGRFTKAAAQMLKANTVMYQEDASKYSEVLTDMKEIIGSGIYSLNDNFAEIWEDAGEWSGESIFEVNYTDNPSSRTWDNPLAVGGSVYPILIGINALKNSKFAGGYGFMPVEETLYNLYDSNDQRKNGGILSFTKHLEDYPNAEYEPRYDDTGFFNLKYLPRSNGNDKYIGDSPEINYRNNYRVFRYSETLLKASELIVRTGGSQTEADSYLNEVRARAYDMDINDAAFAPYKKTASLDNLLQENRLEFACEGHRFWDLVRFGKAEQVLGARGYSSNKKHLPIPQSEIDQSFGTLKQNPY
ncbi:RagB/SusD family nutrient uptake outer membrane protein [Dysgonomonas sp.]